MNMYFSLCSFLKKTIFNKISSCLVRFTLFLVWKINLKKQTNEKEDQIHPPCNHLNTVNNLLNFLLNHLSFLNKNNFLNKIKPHCIYIAWYISFNSISCTLYDFLQNACNEYMTHHDYSSSFLLLSVVSFLIFSNNYAGMK